MKAITAAVGVVARPTEVAPHRWSGRPNSCAGCRHSRMTRLAGARRSVIVAHALQGEYPAALLFDCDGVLVDTEKDGHRVSFNKAFAEKGLDVEWGVEEYGELLKIGGGKERMTHYFNSTQWPAQVAESDADAKQAFVKDMHKLKTDLFMQMVETGALPLRPGVERLVQEAIEASVPVAVCSTSNERAVSAIVRVMLGPDVAEVMQVFAGDIVPKKKPDPAIYLLAAEKLGVPCEKCVVIEDSHIGKSAAKSAGMKCVVTKSGYTGDEDFSGADAVFDMIGDADSARFSLGDVTTPGPLWPA
mmetsp:Transcript_10844/g.39796  ORF Transcript_10844/g.39796 Transcript_10844/m.39796 type:complete len:302 (+) Transcript_10844:48-953(+)